MILYYYYENIWNMIYLLNNLLYLNYFSIRKNEIRFKFTIFLLVCSLSLKW